jgi:predicted PurR-regulated permease PerM
MSSATSRPAPPAGPEDEHARRPPGLAWLPRPGRSSGYDRFVRVGMVAWAIIGVALAGYILLRFVVALQVLVPPVLIAAAVVYLLDPVVSRLARRGVPRLAGTALVYLAFVLLVGMALSVLVPLVTREVATAIDDFPQYATAMQGKLQLLAARFGQDDLRFSIEADRVSSWLGDPVNRQTILNYVTGLRSFTGSVLHAVIVFVIGLIVAFYLLVDVPRLRRGALAMVPPRHRADLEELSTRVGRAVGGFFRGQILVALFVGIASSIALKIVGLPFWLLVGMIAGLFNLVPLIGPWIAGAVAVVIALLNGDISMAIWAAVALALVQQVDNHLISPNVMSRTVQIHPVVVILALLLGATFYGILGMLVAVPLIAAAKICFMYLWVRHVDYGTDLVEVATPPPPPAAEEPD